MSSINIRDVFVPLYVHALKSTLHIIQKGTEYTRVKGIPDSDVLDWRLTPDMNPLSFQIQNICNIARNLIIIVVGNSLPCPLTGAESFADLQLEIARTIQLLEKTTREQFEGRDRASVMVQALGSKMSGMEYVQNFGVPNFYFHNSMIYALFRKHGAPIGKKDFLVGGL